jgi:hypothetical protein
MLLLLNPIFRHHTVLLITNLPLLSSSQKILVLHSRPEICLLLDCVCLGLGVSTGEQIQAMLQQQLDWDFLLRMVEKHRVLPQFYTSLNSTATSLIPTEVAKALRRRFYENVKRNLLLSRELLHLLQLFQAADIQVVPYKGTVLASALYGKQSLRQVWDIDVLVAPADVPKSKELLLQQGYHLKESNDREQSFFHSDRQVEVDLHWGLTPFYFPIHLDFAYLWERCQPMTLAETTITSFAPEDLLLILCIQVAKDCWERRQHLEHLAKVCDIAALLQTYPTLNWATVMQQATSTGAIRIVNFGLYLAQGLLGAELPASIDEQVHNDGMAIALAQQVCAQLFGPIDQSFTGARNSYFDMGLRIRQLNFYLRMRERWQDKIEHFWQILQTFGKLSPLTTQE